MTLDHGAPVEATVFLPGGSLLATAGGTEIRCFPAFILFPRSPLQHPSTKLNMIQRTAIFPVIPARSHEGRRGSSGLPA